MPQDLKRTSDEIERIKADPSCPHLPLKNNRYLLISDLHMGRGGGADDFVHNENVMLKCLENYKSHDFKLILLGDVEDLWQVSAAKAKKRYNDTIYKKIREFGDDNVYRIYGNHDLLWKSPGKADPCFGEKIPGHIVEAVQFVNDEGATVILALHGHQGSIESQLLAAVSRPFVWLYGMTVEPLFRRWGWLKQNAEPNTRIDSNYEQVYYQVALKNEIILICGHSHYAIFESRCYADRLKTEIDQLQKELNLHGYKEETVHRIQDLLLKYSAERLRKREINPADPGKIPFPVYFNTGCCLYTYGITAIELEAGRLRLIKWTENGPITYGEGAIGDYYEKIKGISLASMTE